MTKKLTKRQEKAQAKTEAAKALLVKGTQDLMNSDNYIAALKFRRGFYNYSFRNFLLIRLQLPTASMVASYNAWQDKGRQVIKGETGLSILAPRMVKNKDAKGDDDDKICIGYRTVSVFDISQTEGDDIPTMPIPELLTGDSQDIQDAAATLNEFAVSKGWTVSYTDLSEKGCRGYWSASENLIAIDLNLEPAQQLKTLIHEIAHAMLGHGQDDDTTPRHIKELQAESTAFLVCDNIGLDTSSYSFSYLAGWADSPDEMLKASNTADRIAQQIIEVMRVAPVAA